MDNNDSITPQDFAKQMGAYPNAPYNPVPVGGFMDDGFNWVLGAEGDSVSECCGESLSEGIAHTCDDCGKVDYYLGINSDGYDDSSVSECCGQSLSPQTISTCDKCNKIDYNIGFRADFGNPTEGDFTAIQVRIGSPSGSTTSWAYHFDIKCVGDEDNLSYLTSDIEDEVVDRVMGWNGDEEGNFTTMQVVIGSSSGRSGSWYRVFTVECVGDVDNLSYLTSEIEDVVVDRVKRWNGNEVSYNAESYSQIMGPTVEANEGNLHSPSSFDITWEDGTGQSSASMPPNEIHFGAEDWQTNDKFWEMLHEEHDYLFDEDGIVKISNKQLAEIAKDMGFGAKSFNAKGDVDDCPECGGDSIQSNRFQRICQKCNNEWKIDVGQFGAEAGYDFQKMTPSPFVPFDQIGNELQQQRDESGPMLEPTNANFGADSPSPASPLDDVPALVPSPAEPTNSNFNSEHKRDYVTMILGTAALVVGSGMFAKSQGWLVTDTKAADTDDLPSIDPTVNDGLVASPTTGDLLPADYEEMIVESTGYAVQIIPISLDPSFMGSRFQALPTDRLVDSNEPGIGAHTDVAMYRDTLYREPEQSMVQAPSLNAEGDCNCSLLDKLMAFFKGEECSCETEVKESQGVGQTPYFGFGFERKNPQLRVIKETGPISLDPSVASYLPQNLSGYTGQSYRPPTIYGDMMGLGMAGASVPFINPNESTVGANRYGSNPVDSSTLQSIHGNLSSSTNASYTNGSKTMSLAQWSIDYDVSQTSDSEAVAVSRSSGIRTMIRRV